MEGEEPGDAAAEIPSDVFILTDTAQRLETILDEDEDCDSELSSSTGTFARSTSQDAAPSHPTVPAEPQPKSPVKDVVDAPTGDADDLGKGADWDVPAALQTNRPADAEHSHADLLRAVYQVKHWAEILETQSKGKKTCVVPIEAGDLAKLCRVVQWMHVEFEHVSKQSREASRVVALVSAQGKNNRDSLQLTKQAVKTIQKDMQDDICQLREEYVKRISFDKATERVSRLEMKLAEEFRVESERLGSEVECLHTMSRTHSDGLNSLLERLQELSDIFHDHHRRLLDERNRVDNATFRVENTSATLQEVRRKIKNAEGLRPDVEHMAQSVAALSKDIAAVKLAQIEQKQMLRDTQELLAVGAGIAGANGQGAGEDSSPHNSVTNGGSPNAGASMALSGFAGLSKRELQQVKDAISRVDHMEDMMRQFSTVQNQMQIRVRDIKLAEADMSRVENKIRVLDERTSQFERSVTEQLASVTKKKAKDALTQFDQKWQLFHKQETNKFVFVGWKKYVEKCNRLREAMRKTKHLYARSHAVTRMRSWWYITQKDMVTQNYQRLTDVATLHGQQLDGLQERVSRYEKASAEQARGFMARLNTAEKSLEVQQTKKADMSTVHELVDGIGRRLDKDYDLAPVRKNMDELIKSVGTLQREKMDADVAERQRKKVLDLIADIRGEHREFSNKLDTRASISDLAQKAEARVMEEVVVLLAKQADQLAGLVAADLERIRAALARFLELSPDIRKSALSLGLQPNERCVMCGPTKGAENEPHFGTDGKTYLVPPEAAVTGTDQAKLVFQQRLQMPSLLLSSLAMASQLRDANAQCRAEFQEEACRPSSACAAPRFHGFANNGTVQDSELAALPKLRKLVAEAPGWSARPLGREAATPSPSGLSTAASTTGSGRCSVLTQAGTPRPQSRLSNNSGGASPAGGAPGGDRRGQRSQTPTPNGASDETVGRRPNAARSYFPAVGQIRARGSGRSSVDE